MAWTPTTLRARWPEFTKATDDEVNAALADAIDNVDERVFGSSYDRAVGLYAAHLLSLAQYGKVGQRGAIDQKPPGTKPQPDPYLAEFDRLSFAKAGGMWTVGIDPDGNEIP